MGIRVRPPRLLLRLRSRRCGYAVHHLRYGFNSFGEEYEAELNIWDRGNGEAFANAKAEEVYASIGYGGTMLPCDNGGIWIKRGTPFCQTVRDSADVHRRYINIVIENLTNE